MALQSLTISESRDLPAFHLVEEINHRVINEYTQAISSLSLAAARSSSPAAREALTSAAKQLLSFADTHRALVPPVEEDAVNLADYVSQLCEKLTKSMLAGKQVRLSLKTDDIRISAGRAWRIGLMLSELIRNAFRHGLSHHQAGTIVIRLTGRSGAVSCLVCDNGRATANPRSGRGQRLVQAIAAEMRGSVQWHFTNTGSCVRLEVPLSDFWEGQGRVV